MKRGVQPVPSGAPNPQPTPPGVLTEEVFNERMQGTTAGFLGFQRDQNKITREHFAKFGEVVELEPLLTHPRIAEVGLLGVYDLVHADRLKAHQEAAVKKHDDAVAAEAVRKFQEAHAQMPYPAPNGSGSGSPLDALASNKDQLVDEAAAHYQRLVAARLAGTP
jgi:hypothetical protein